MVQQSTLVKERSDRISDSPLRTWKYEYSYAGGTFAFDSVLLFTKETDPLDNYTETRLDTFLTLIKDIYGNPMYYYKHGVVKQIEKFSSFGNRLYRKEFI
ncbi:MAG: hypothetical protein N2510_06945, partial [Ignavibacteria bacterium]|nr:hypothetical protein [Ignavibacteria bacterium]